MRISVVDLRIHKRLIPHIALTDQQVLKGVVEFLLIRSKFYPEMFRHTVAILRRSQVLYKLPEGWSLLWACADYDPSSVASCCGMCWSFYNRYYKMLISTINMAECVY
jgi:hypothetical protein